jgi:N-methylhydantoinase B
VNPERSHLPRAQRPATDPIRVEVIRHALAAAAEEMALSLQRAAYSTNIKTRLDFSCALFDAGCRLVAQSFGQANHLGSLTHFVPQMIERYGADRLGPGDALLSNGGAHGGVHLNDVCLAAPIFHDDAIVGYVAALAHHLDVGGSQPGSISGRSRTAIEEGIAIPPVRLLRDGVIDEDLFALLRANIRAPRETGGDLRAQIAAINAGTRRIEALIERYGIATLRETIDVLFDYTERRARDQISAIPDGTYVAEGFMDDDGVSSDPVRIVVRVTVDGERIAFDLDGTDAQRPCAINATYAMTLSSCAYVTRALMDEEIPVNAGFYRVLSVDAAPGSIVNCDATVAIGGGWETAFRVVETGFAALAHAIPERLTAGSKGCLCNFAFGGRGRDGEPFVFYEAIGGGYGARAERDGIDAVQPHVQNTENAPVEETEAAYPVRIERYELIADSEGAGRRRGGLGLRRDYRFEVPVTLSLLSDRAKFAPAGLAGGGDARCARYVLDPEGRAQELGSKTTLDLDAGAMISVQIGGGGGFGPASEREPERVVADVRSGRVTAQRARDAYGVAVDAEGALDAAATARLRRDEAAS